jgi:hypothetical protein
MIRNMNDERMKEVCYMSEFSLLVRLVGSSIYCIGFPLLSKL